MQAARGAAVATEAAAAPRLDPGRRRRLRAVFAAVASGGLLLDVVTKIAAVAWLEPRVGVPVLSVSGVDLLTLRLIRNPGAAFSSGEGITWVFALAAIAVLGFVLLRLVPRIGHPGWAVALGLLCAGVGGNLVDRLLREPGPLRGHVVDFLQLPRWPIFNVADLCITSAAVLILVLSVVKNVGVAGEHYTREASGSGAGRRTDDADG